MGFLEALTIVFIILKVVGFVSFSWLFVFSPLLVALAGYVLWFVFVGLIYARWS